MFAGLETIPQSPARGWTAMLSFTVQAATVAAALVLPLLSPRLPETLITRRIFVPVLSGGFQVQPSQLTRQSSGLRYLMPVMVSRDLIFRFRQTSTQAMGSENAPAPNLFIGSSGTEDGARNFIAEILARPVPQPIPAVRPPRSSVMMEGNLVRRVEPTYPAIAKQAGIEGTVVIKAVISRTGAIEQEQIVSGPPFLARAALDAVRQWQYRPYLLNGEAVAVETQVTVRFVLNR